MDGSIGQLDCRFHLGGETGVVDRLAARLKRVAHERLPAAYAAALEAALDGDPSVYVLRHVNCALSLAVPESAADAELAERWGERLAGGVVRAIARGDADCVRFASQADFVARFAADLLRGDAWGRWYYGAFASLCHLPAAQALRAVLLDHRACLPAVLGALHQLGELETLLQTLDSQALAELWERGVLSPSLEPAEAQLFFASALVLIDNLELWAGARAGQDALQAYLATRPPAANWRDRQSLALALYDVLRFLATRGYLSRPSGADLPNLPARLEQASAALDWLDTALLCQHLLELLAPPPALAIDLPTRPRASGSTPRQRALLDELQAVLRERDAQLDRGQPDAAANALRLHTWLVARDPSWASDSFALTLIERILRAWRAIWTIERQAQALDLLRQRNVAGALLLLPGELRGKAAGSLHWLVELGQPGVLLVEALLQGTSHPPPLGMPTDRRGQPPASSPWSPAEAEMIPTGCAGVALLLRAVLDLRLPSVLSGETLLAGLPPDERLRTVLLALGLRWSGVSGSADGRIDRGLCMLAGWDDHGPDTVAALRALWVAGEGEHDRFQAALLRVLLGQRLMGGSTLYVHLLPMSDATQALIAGDESAALWPLGCVVRSADAIADAIARWSATWVDITGSEPTFVVAQELAAHTARAGSAIVVGPGDDIAPARMHRSSQERLVAALAALDHGQIGSSTADLTIALAAIALLRGWCRWLHQFGESSVPYLLKQFVDRRGGISARPDRLLIELAPMPLDIVLQMSGYTAEIQRVPWLGGRSMQFLIRS